jgi:hypothetical protein
MTDKEQAAGIHAPKLTWETLICTGCGSIGVKPWPITGLSCCPERKPATLHALVKGYADAARSARAPASPTDDAIRSTVKLNSTPDRHCTVFKGTEITGYTLTDEGIAELRKLFGGAPVAVTDEMVRIAMDAWAETACEGFKKLPAMRAALEAVAPFLRGVPEGWKLVPKKPTPEMIAAGREMSGQPVYEESEAKNIWDDMFTAAPQPGVTP